MTDASWPGLFPPALAGGLPSEGLEAYAQELARWNRTVRLVGPRDLGGIRLQIADALYPFLRVAPHFPLLDIGSGAGLPAIPLALAFPGQSVVCLEPLGKRVSFLRHAVRTLALPGIRVVQARAEEALGPNPELRGAFASATARAVANPVALLKAAHPFLAAAGRVFVLRGPGVAASHPGWELLEDVEYPPPPGLGPRRLQIYRKLD